MIHVFSDTLKRISVKTAKPIEKTWHIPDIILRSEGNLRGNVERASVFPPLSYNEEAEFV